MTSVAATLVAGDVVHAWLKPIGTASRGSLTVAAAGRDPEALVVEAPTRGHLSVQWECPGSGPAELTWEAADTDVSVIYAFSPGSVARQGIRILWTSAEARADEARHALHARAPFGWMNDPNGLCELDGTTHLFYQHNPHGRRWDTMHWGHAVSRDRVHWTHLPVMLRPPDELLRAPADQGGVFSGTVLPRPGGPLRFFFTHRQESRRPAREWQMTAVSQDGIAAGPAKPVLDAHPPLTGYRDDWRDPFVFPGPDGKLKMLLAGADASSSLVLLYETDDPEGSDGWRFVDVLFREPSTRAIPAECPCIVELDGEGQGLWVLIFGLLGSRDEATRRRNLTRAHIGRFDGRHFEPLHEHELDFGTDCYAMQVWRGGDGPHGIAWAANWTDVFSDRDFESAMTFPRRLVWRNGGLETPPVDALESLRDGPAEPVSAASMPVRAGLAELDLEVEPGTAFSLAIDHPTHEMALVYDGTEVEFRYEPPGHRAVPRYRTRVAGLSSVRVFIDVGLIEIFLEGGRACCTKRLDSAEPVTSIQLDAARVRSARLWPLRPASASTV